ncbi:hypothetical protein AGMMS4952_21140 [Spirochaetia bacterium]|nr:hypothetical protein AGMMS4952_21140 [Spirochaetia bacterium]
MDCKKYLKLNIILPIIIGIIIGTFLVFSRIFDDIPGLPLVVIIVCFGSIYYSIHNVQKINGKIKPRIIVPLLFGTLGIIGSFITIYKEKFDDSPGVLLIIGALCIGLIFIGLFNIKNIRQKINPGIFIPLFYCISGIVLAIILEFDGELTKMQRSIVIMIFVFIAIISISLVMIIRRIKLLKKVRPNCT